MANNVKKLNSEMPHIGSIIKTSMGNNKYARTQLAKKLYTRAVSLTRYTEQKSLQCYVVWNLSEALNVNLFEILAKAHPVQTPVAPDPKQLEMQQRITDLEKELAIYKEIVKGKMG